MSPAPASQWTPLVTVVVATNRRSRYLEAALRSVAEQDYPQWEIVLVDDGSPDPVAVADVAARFARVRVIRQDNAGVAVARNVGIADARGELLAFLDDDDVWLTDRLALQVDSLRARPDAVLSYGRVSSIDDTGRQIAPADQRPASDIHAVFGRDATPQFQTVLIRRATVSRIGGFHSSLALAEDLDLILRAAREGPFVFVDREIVRYRAHRANVSANSRELALSIDAVLRLHRRARGAREDGTYRDLRRGLRRNRSYIAWSGSRAVSADLARGRLGRAAAEAAWVARHAADVPFVIAARRVRALFRRGD